MIMKRILTLVAVVGALAAAAFSVYAFVRPMTSEPLKTDNRGHVLAEQWKAFSDAVTQDRPKTQAAALEEIIAKSKEQRLPWDFFEGWEHYIDAVSARDWKQRGTLQGKYAEDVKAFDEPIVTFSWMRGNNSSRSAGWEWVRKNADVLKASRNEQFYRYGATSDNMGGVLSKYIESDYEYCLWAILSSYGDYMKGYEGDPVYAELSGIVGDAYPKAAYLEYRAAHRYTPEYKTTPALEAVAQKYKGKAIGLCAEDDLVSIKKRSLDREKAGQDAYKALLATCQDIEKRHAALVGEEARIGSGITAAKDCIEELKSKSAAVVVIGERVTVILRNLPSIKVSLYEREGKKALFSTTVQNKKASFYVADTVRATLPRIDDGSYRVEATYGKQVSSSDFFEKYTLSIAVRRSDEGRGVYVTDYESGEPLKKVDLKLLSGGRVKASSAGVELGDGFTKLPEKIESSIKIDKHFTLQASCKDSDGFLRKSKPCSVSDMYGDDGMIKYERKFCRIFLDRGAFNPGDSVHFKALLYKGDMIVTAGVAKADIPVEATLYDSAGNKLETINLKTNSFGTVAGAFSLPTGLRNGRFRIAVSGEGYSNSIYFPVDEFVLPTFDLTFDKSDELHLPGDTIAVSGVLKSYSGHSLASANLRWQAVYGSTVLGEGEVKAADDGRFKFEFATLPDVDWQYCNVTVNVVDATGETHEFSDGYAVGTWFGLSWTLSNRADAQLAEIVPKPQGERDFYNSDLEVLDGESACGTFYVRNREGGLVPIGVHYVVKDEDGNVLTEGDAISGQMKEIDLSMRSSGLFTMEYGLKVTVPGSKQVIERREMAKFIKLSADAPVVDAPVRYVFRAFDLELETGDEMKVQFGAADGPVWAVVELSGEDCVILDRKVVYLVGKRAAVGSVTDIVFPYKAEYPDAVRLKVFFFRDRSSVCFERQFHRHRHTLDLPLSFSSFEDKTYPATEYTFKVKTLPEVECLAAVFDKSLDAVNPNDWQSIGLSPFGVPSLYISSVPGAYGRDYYFADAEYVTGAVGGGRRMMSKAARNAAVMPEMMVMESAAMMDSAEEVAQMSEEDAGSVKLRENFANMLTFQPFLRSDENGEISFTFSTSDKLSTYYVALFAHNRELRNAVDRREMVVSIPAKVAVQEPKYLYVGDTYNMTVTVSSNSDAPVSGRLALFQYDGADHRTLQPVATKTVALTVPPRCVESRTFSVKVPYEPGIRGLKVVFLADKASGDFSDAVFVPVPVYPRSQVLTEAHSAVLLPGMDREAVIAQIRKAFVNTSSMGAEYKEISIVDMVREAIPSKVEPSSENVLDLTEAWYVRLIAEKLGVKSAYEMSTDKILGKISACQNADGGFGWFEGMDSSPVLTSIVLERAAKLRDAGLAKTDFVDVEKAVKFLDKNEFDLEWPFWCGGVSIDQYLYVRSLYPAIRFKVSPTGLSTDFSKRMKEFKQYTSEYLTPAKERGLNGRILAKARRLKTLQNLAASSDGIALAKAWGIGISAADKVKASLEADVVSLLEYAVDHKDGGVYYPNAVMPFRGLLENEAYAHSMLCDLFTVYAVPGAASAAEATRVADGVRIWLMLQKETQKWDEDPAFVDALNSILSGSDEVLSTRVILMRKTFEKPFDKIKAAGNGMKISRSFFRIKNSGGRVVEERISAGTKLEKGDKIRAVYSIWNGENRSFVRIRAPREAALRPVEQLSGMYGWGVRPMRITNWFSFRPSGYRDVKTDRTEYWFDTYPEENTTISEEFFVTQSGSFCAPVLEIESLYAPHYRANSAANATLHVR